MIARAMQGAVKSRPLDEVNMLVGVSGCFELPYVSHRAKILVTKTTHPMTRGAMTCTSVDG
jgi:hypothetical protein